MRKKSHISLAGYLVREMNLEEFDRHKKAFYLGSILPNLTPKMITSPHEFQTSYEELQGRIHTLLQDAGTGDYKERVLFRRMGVVMHYLADYFTFPHNVTYGGSLKDHCLYERDMKHALRSYVRTSEAQQIFRLQQMRQGQIRTANELFAYIERMHRDYLRHPHSAQDDCRWIVELCSWVMIGMVNIIASFGVRGEPVEYHCAG